MARLSPVVALHPAHDRPPLRQPQPRENPTHGHAAANRDPTTIDANRTNDTTSTPRLLLSAVPAVPPPGQRLACRQHVLAAACPSGAGKNACVNRRPDTAAHPTRNRAAQSCKRFVPSCSTRTAFRTARRYGPLTGESAYPGVVKAGPCVDRIAALVPRLALLSATRCSCLAPLRGLIRFYNPRACAVPGRRQGSARGGTATAEHATPLVELAARPTPATPSRSRHSRRAPHP